MLSLIIGRILTTQAGAEMPAPTKAKWNPASKQLVYWPRDTALVPVFRLVKFAIEYGQKSGFVIEPGTGAEWGWMLVMPAGRRAMGRRKQVA